MSSGSETTITFRDRGYIKLPLIKINWARNGLRFYYTSTTFHIGRYSWNTRQRKHHFDHPGPGWWEGKRRHKK